MFRILLSTDFSDHAFRASVFAARLFGVEGVSYQVVHAYLDADPAAAWAGRSEDLYRAAMEGMEAWKQRLAQDEVMAKATIEAQVVYGPLPIILNELSKESGVDLVVMGTMGRTGAGILGSNAVAMAKQSRYPVLIVPAQATGASLGKVLFADDRKVIDKSNLAMMVRIATLTGAEVVIAHVGGKEDELEGGAGRAAEFHQLLGAVPHRLISMEGEDVASAIDEAAKAEGAGMIAVLHRHVGFFEGIFKRSTTKRLALTSTIPLLVMQDREVGG